MRRNHDGHLHLLRDEAILLQAAKAYHASDRACPISLEWYIRWTEDDTLGAALLV